MRIAARKRMLKIQRQGSLHWVQDGCETLSAAYTEPKLNKIIQRGSVFLRFQTPPVETPRSKEEAEETTVAGEH